MEILRYVIGFVAGNVLRSRIINRDGPRGGHVSLDANSLGRGRATNSLAGGGAKDFQSELFAGLFSVIVSRFLDGGLLAGIFFLKIFRSRNFISRILAPYPAISYGPPLILAVRGYEFNL